MIESYLLENVDAELEKLAFEMERSASADQPVRNYTQERARLQKKLSRLKDLYVDDIIDLELYRKDYEALSAQLDSLLIEERESAATRPSTERLRSILSYGWQDMYAALSRADQQAFWRSVLDRILIYPTRQITISFRF